MIITSSLSLRARHVLRVATVAVASLGVAGGLVFADADVASAQEGALPINALAAEVTESARDAVAAFDRFAMTGDVADERMYAWHRAITARYTARQIGYDELAMIDAWSDASLDHQRAVLGALTQVGVPYRTNANREGEAFDCSGLTSYAWSGAGYELVHQSGSQIAASEPRTRETASAGDLVHYPGHIMMYLGVDDAIVHTYQTGRTVEIDTISERSRDRVTFGDPIGG